MSRKHRHECCHDEDKCCDRGFDRGIDNCCCSFPTLVILILIILQFNRNGRGLLGANVGQGVGNFVGEFGTVDNSILFIIALFYLACCNPCKRW